MSPTPTTSTSRAPERHPRRAARRSRAVAVPLVALAAAAAVVAACSSPSPASTSSTTSTTSVTPPTTTATSSSATTTARPSATAPATTRLTGGPVLAAKIDNTSASRPRIGVGKADVVYVEPVEAGLTRLLVVWSSTMPGEIGPVRSSRETDVDLLANYGRVAFAFSGGSAGTLATLATGRQVNLSNDASGVGFRRASDRPAPYNVIGNTAELLQRAGGSVSPSDPGFRFGAAPPGGRPGTVAATAWAASRIDLHYDPATKTYLVLTDGRADIDADGTQHAAATVVVEHVSTTLSANTDVNGVRTPLARVVGTGTVDVLRDGRAWTGTWSRPSPGSPTAYALGSQSLTMEKGQIWVLLVPNGQAVTIR